MTAVRQQIASFSLILPLLFGAAAAEAADIVDTAQSDGQFRTLVAAVEAAGLIETLKGAGPFTMFAPTDEAFAKLPAGTMEALLKPENLEQLVAVLSYHVVPGRVLYKDVQGKVVEAATVQGTTARLDDTYGGPMIDNARILRSDIETSNGVIHVIDAVIVPQ